MQETDISLLLLCRDHADKLSVVLSTTKNNDQLTLYTRTKKGETFIAALTRAVRDTFGNTAEKLFKRHLNNMQQIHEEHSPTAYRHAYALLLPRSPLPLIENKSTSTHYREVLAANIEKSTLREHDKHIAEKAIHFLTGM